MLAALRDAWRSSDKAKLLGFSDNRRVCAKHKCKSLSERTLRGRGLSAGLAGGSIYCVDHACRKLEQSGEFCKTATKRGQPYCEAHLQCRKPRCDKTRKGGNKKSYYCLEDHGCRYEDCPNERLIRPDEEKKWRYCYEHTCEDHECNALKSSSFVRFCKDHRCAYSSCNKYVKPNADRARREPQERYCEKHRPCKTGGCSEGVHKLKSGKVLGHCKDHYCEYEHECDDERLTGTTGCQRHTCKYSNCTKKLTDTPASIYCDDHECKTMQCWNRRYLDVVKSERCTEHICRDYLKEKCDREGDPNHENYCELHQRCEVEGCNDPRYQENGRVKTKCRRHEKGICQWNVSGVACSDEVHDKDCHFCKKHQCMAHPGCSIQRAPFGPFCLNHKCAKLMCQNQRSMAANAGGSAFGTLLSSMIAVEPSLANLPMYAMGQFCDRHRCCAEGCDRERRGDEDIDELDSYPPGKFCARHTCHEEDCQEEARQRGKDAGYCHAHHREDSSSDDDGGGRFYSGCRWSGFHGSGRPSRRRHGEKRHRRRADAYWIGPQVQW